VLDELRFERAKLLLHETEWPIYRIADSLGLQ
jgi:AraC-like DNA-binding protein